MLDSLQRKTDELYVSKDNETYLESDDHVDLAHAVLDPVAVTTLVLFIRKLIIESVRDDETDEDHGVGEHHNFEVLTPFPGAAGH